MPNLDNHGQATPAIMKMMPMMTSHLVIFPDPAIWGVEQLLHWRP